MTAAWKDITSYQLLERGKKEPDSWELQLPTSRLRVAVFRPRHAPDQWAVSCYWRLGTLFDSAPLKARLLPEAQQEALLLVWHELVAAADELSGARP